MPLHLTLGFHHGHPHTSLSVVHHHHTVAHHDWYGPSLTDHHAHGGLAQHGIGHAAGSEMHSLGGDHGIEHHSDWYTHHGDCDHAYQHDPVQRFVCNVAETHHVAPTIRHCLQTEQGQGVGAVQRHLDCWGRALWGR